jgi:dTDP-4-amino-4,6-dideoxygalactose transaminase
MEHGFYRLYAYVRPDGLRSGWTRDRLVEALNQRGLPAFQGSCSEVYLEKAFDGTGFAPPERLPVARELGETSIAFLVHPTLSDENIALAKSVIEAVFSEASN